MEHRDDFSTALNYLSEMSHLAVIKFSKANSAASFAEMTANADTARFVE